MRIAILLLTLMYLLTPNVVNTYVERSKPMINHGSLVYPDCKLQLIESADSNLRDVEREYGYSRKIIRPHQTILMYLGETRVLEVQFDSSGTKTLVWDHEYCKNEELMLCAEVNMDLESIRMIDPDGTYLFLHTGRNDAPKESTHYFKDGSVMRLSYGENNKVTAIDFE